MKEQVLTHILLSFVCGYVLTLLGLTFTLMGVFQVAYYYIASDILGIIFFIISFYFHYELLKNICKNFGEKN